MKRQDARFGLVVIIDLKKDWMIIFSFFLFIIVNKNKYYYFIITCNTMKFRIVRYLCKSGYERTTYDSLII